MLNLGTWGGNKKAQKTNTKTKKEKEKPQESSSLGLFGLDDE